MSVDKDPVNGLNIVQCVEPVATFLYVCHRVALCIVPSISLHPVNHHSIDCQVLKGRTVPHNAFVVAKQSSVR